MAKFDNRLFEEYTSRGVTGLKDIEFSEKNKKEIMKVLWDITGEYVDKITKDLYNAQLYIYFHRKMLIDSIEETLLKKRRIQYVDPKVNTIEEFTNHLIWHNNQYLSEIDVKNFPRSFIISSQMNDLPQEKPHKKMFTKEWIIKIYKSYDKDEAIEIFWDMKRYIEWAHIRSDVPKSYRDLIDLFGWATDCLAWCDYWDYVISLIGWMKISYRAYSKSKRRTYKIDVSTRDKILQYRSALEHTKE